MAARTASEKKPAAKREQVGRAGSRRQRIAKLLCDVEKRLDIENGKVTLADFIRLTQLERELADEEQPREIVVTWKDPAEKRSE